MKKRKEQEESLKKLEADLKNDGSLSSRVSTLKMSDATENITLTSLRDEESNLSKKSADHEGFSLSIF